MSVTVVLIEIVIWLAERHRGHLEYTRKDNALGRSRRAAANRDCDSPQLGLRPSESWGDYHVMTIFDPRQLITGMILGAVILGFPQACGAQENTLTNATPLSVQKVFGFWRATGGAGTGVCYLTLQADLQGDKATASPANCDSGQIAAATHWRPEIGGFALLDKTGAVLIRFRQMNVDVFVGTGESGEYRLSRAPMV